MTKFKRFLSFFLSFLFFFSYFVFVRLGWQSHIVSLMRAPIRHRHTYRAVLDNILAHTRFAEQWAMSTECNIFVAFMVRLPLQIMIIAMMFAVSIWMRMKTQTKGPSGLWKFVIPQLDCMRCKSKPAWACVRTNIHIHIHLYAMHLDSLDMFYSMYS